MSHCYVWTKVERIRPISIHNTCLSPVFFECVIKVFLSPGLTMLARNMHIGMHNTSCGSDSIPDLSELAGLLQYIWNANYKAL